MAEQPLDYATPTPPGKSRGCLWGVLMAVGVLFLLLLMYLLTARAIVVPGPAPAPAPAPTVTSPGGGR